MVHLCPVGAKSPKHGLESSAQGAVDAPLKGVENMEHGPERPAALARDYDYLNQVILAGSRAVPMAVSSRQPCSFST